MIQLKEMLKMYYSHYHCVYPVQPKLNAAKNSMIYYDNYVFVFSYEKSSTINCSLHTSCIF